MNFLCFALHQFFFFPLHGLASCMFTYHSCTLLVASLHQTPRELAKQLPSAKAQEMLKMFDGENYLPGYHSHIMFLGIKELFFVKVTRIE